MSKINNSGNYNTIFPNKTLTIDTSSVKKEETKKIIEEFLNKRHTDPTTPFYPSEFLIRLEEIKNHSLLNRDNNQNTPQELLSLLTASDGEYHPTLDELNFNLIQYAANFACGGLITGGEGEYALEGTTPKLNFKMWQWLLNKIDSTNFSTNQQHLNAFQKIKSDVAAMAQHFEEVSILVKKSPVKNPEAYAKEANKIAKKIQKLQTGQSTTMYLGWSAKGADTGHAMLMRVEKNETGTLEIFIYNSTNSELSNTISIGGKNRRVPLVKYSNVPVEWFLAEEPSSNPNLKAPIILKSFLELRSQHADVQGLKHTFEDILEILDMIAPFKVSVDPQEKGASTGQRAGTCVTSVTKEWIQDNSPNINVYKRIMHQTKLELLVGTFLALKDTLAQDTPFAEIARRELVFMSEKLLRRICKLQNDFYAEDFPISEKESLEARATTHDILNHIKECQKAIAYRRRSAVQKLNLNTADISLQTADRISMDFDYATTRIEKYHPNLACLNTEITLGNSIQSFNQCFEDTFKSYNNLRHNGQRDVAKLQLQHFIAQLPVPVCNPNTREFSWDLENTGGNQDDLKKALENIYDLTLLYIDSDTHSRDLVSKKQATILPLYAIAHYLGIEIEKHLILPEDAQLKSYQFPYPFETLNLEGIQYFDKKDFDKIQACTAYFVGTNSTNKPVLFPSETTAELQKKEIVNKKAQGNLNNPGNAQFWAALLTNESLKDTIDKLSQSKSYRKLTDKEIEDDYQEQQNTWRTYLANCEKYETYQKLKTKYDEDLKAWTKLPTPQRHKTPCPTPPIIVNEPVAPPRPEKKFNLSDEARLNAVLETLNSYTDPLEKTEYSYITLLREVIYCSLKNCREGDTSAITYASKDIDGYAISRSPPKRWDHNSHSIEISSSDKEEECKLEKLKETLEGQGRPVSDKQKKFLMRDVASRLKSKWLADSAEGNNLKEFGINRNLLTNLDRTLSEDNISPIQFLYLLEADLSLLKDPLLQSHILQLLFRSPVTSTGMSLGTGDLILQDKALIDKAFHFIQKGIHHFRNIPEGIGGLRFFLELAAYFCKYAADGDNEALSNKFNLKYTLEEWLKRGKLTEEEELTFYQFNTLFHTIHPPKNLEEYSTLYSSWILYNQSPAFNTAIKTPFLTRYLEGKMQEITANLPATLDFAQLGQQIAQKMAIDSSLEIANWDRVANSSPDLYTDNNWFINLAQGKVYSPTGPLSGVAKPYRWEESLHFRRLFYNNKGMSYRRLGENTLFFKDQEKGSFQIIETRSKAEYYIKKRFVKHLDFFQYVPETNADLRKALPLSLLEDYAYWQSPKNFPLPGSAEMVKGVITDLESLSPCYVILTNGDIVETTPTLDRIVNPTICFHSLESKEPKALSLQPLSDFDDLYNILTTYQNKKLESISFPRYQSLKFISRNGGMVWTHNVDFRLSTEKPKGLLGTIPNYLHLTSVKGDAELIIVPYQKIQTLVPGPIAQGLLAIENTQARFKTKSDPNKRPLLLNGQQHYGVYEVEDRKIIPTDLDSKLFLAYIELSQKRYAEAVSLLKSIKPIERISSIGLQTLMDIMELPIGEHHPDATMVKLHALCAYCNEQMETKNTEIDSFFKADDFDHLPALSIIIKSFSQALSLYNNISSACRLQRDQEILILDVILKEIKINNKPICPTLFKSNELDAIKQIFKQRLDYLKHGLTSPLLTTQNRTPFSYRSNMGQSEGRNYLETNKMNFTISDLAPITEPLKPGSASFYKECFPNLTWQEAEKRAEEKKMGYLKELPAFKASLKWFNEGKSIYSLPATYNPLGTKFFVDNGTALREIIQCAFNGKKEERAALLHRLYQWRIHSHPEAKHFAMDFYISILTDPNEYRSHYNPLTSLLSDNISLEEKYDSLINNIYHYKYSLDSKNFKTVFDNLWAATKKMSGPYPTPAKADDSGKYPFMSQPIFDTNMYEPKKDIAKEPIKNLKIASQNERWNQLNTWKGLFNGADAVEVAISKDFEFTESAALLNEQEKIYEESLKNDLKTLAQDYQAGKEINKAKTIKDLTARDCSTIALEANESLKNLIDERTQKMAILIALANEAASDGRKKEIELAKIGGQATSGLTFESCIECLLTGDQHAFRKKNPNLTDTQIHTICQLTIEILDNQSHQAQLKRVISLTEKITSSSGSKRTYYCQSLYEECGQKYYFEGFNEEEKIALHVFSGKSGFIPFEKQVNLLKKMLEANEVNPAAFKDIVIQLIMGGGKTSVIASILLYLSARRSGRMAFFIVPPSLHEVVSSNLAEGMHNAFGKTVHSINLQREEFTTYKLTILLNKLKSIQVSDDTAIVSAVTLQGLELEMLSLSRKLAKGTIKKVALQEAIAALEHTFHRSHSENLNLDNLKSELASLNKDLGLFKTNAALIASIRALTKQHADALVDEVDIVKDCLQELNYVDGEKHFVNPSRNDLLMHIFKGMVNNNLKCKTDKGVVSLPHLIRLQSNQQALLPKSVFLEKAAPLLASYIFETFKPINQQLNNDCREAFIRYSVGNTPLELQKYVDTAEVLTRQKASNIEVFKNRDFKTLQDDIAFLKLLKTLSTSKIEKERNTADLTALCKHFLCDLLPATLSKIGGRNYGASQHENSIGKIIPYLAVNTPAATEFGYHWEAACYQYQFGLGSKPSKELVLSIAEMARHTADHFIQKNGEALRKTAENQEFFETFGVHLDEMHDPMMAERAVDTVAKNPEKLLEMEYELISRYVTYASERLSSNGFALVDLISSCQAMSGTPWNVEGYEEKLASRFEADIGTEGRILHKLAERAKDKKIHAVDFRENETAHPFTMKEFLVNTYKEMKNPKAVRGIIEAGGLFKAFGTNSDVAKSWIEFIAERQEAEQALPFDQKTVDPSLEGVLFFHKEENSLQPDTLYVWKKGAESPERIGGTTVAALHAKGLNPSKYAMYYDERHTTGTDVLQMPDCVNLITFDEKMTLRTLMQSIMRLRQFLFEQDVEFVVSKSTQHTLFNNGQSIQDLILNAAKVQSIGKTEAMVRFFTQHINHLFRRHAVQKIADMINSGTFDEKFANLVKRYEPFFVTSMSENPFEQYGRLDQFENTKNMLKDILLKKFSQFEQMAQDDPELIENVRTDVKSLEKWIDKAQSLPTKSKDMRKNGSLNAEVLQQVEVHKEVQVEVEIEQEIEIELKRFESSVVGPIKAEPKLTYNKFLELLNALKANTPCNAIRSLQKQIQERQEEYGYPIDKIFKEPIFGTSTYFETVQGGQNIFHPTQRPPHQILAIEGDDGKMRWLLFSEHEAGAVKEHMKALAQPDAKTNGIDPDKAWFIQPDGSPIADYTGEAYPFDLDEIQKGMIELNAFGGNMSYLDGIDQKEHFEDWLEGDSSLNAVKVRFLKWRTFRMAKQKQLLLASPTIARACGQQFQEMVGVPQYGAKRRIEMERNLQGSFFPVDLNVDNPDLSVVKNLKPAQLKKLNVQYIPYLGIDPEANDPHTAKSVQEIANKNGIDPADKDSVKELLRTHNEDVFNRLQRWQVRHLKAEQIRWLPANQVKYLENSQQIEQLDQEQVLGLDESQEHLVKYVKQEHFVLFDQKWQIENVPYEHLTKVNPEYAKYFTKHKLKHLSLDYIQKICKDWTNNWGYIHGDLIEHIPHEMREYICEEQVKEITNPELIKSIEDYRVNEIHDKPLTQWVDPSMVCHVADENIQYLCTPEQIEKIPQPKLNKIVGEQVPWLIEEQVTTLLKMDHIDDLIPHIHGKHLLQLTQEKWIDQITAQQLEEFGSARFNLLPNSHPLWKLDLSETIVNALKDEKLENLSVPSLKHLQPAKVSNLGTKMVEKILKESDLAHLIPHIDFKYLPLFKEEDVVELVTEEQLEKFGVAGFNKLSNSHPLWNKIPSEFLNDLKEEKLKVVPLRILKSMPSESVKKLGKQMIAYIQQNEELLDLISTINAEHLSEVKNEKAVEKVTFDQVNAFGALGFEKLNEDHPLWKKITKSVVKQLDERKLHLVPVSLLTDLPPTRVAEFCGPGIEVILKHKELHHLFSFINKKFVASLSEELVEIIQSNPKLHELVPFLNPDQLHLLKAQVMSKVTDKQIEAFGSAGFNKLEDKHPLWDRITASVAAGINPDKVYNVAKEMFKHLKNVDTIKRLNQNDFVHLTKQQLVHRRADRWAYILGTLTLGLIKCVIALLGSIFIPLVYLAGKKTGRRYCTSIGGNIRRPFHLFTTYMPATFGKVEV